MIFIPNGWTETTLGDVCLKITDGSHSSPASTTVGNIMASVKDLTPFGINLDNARKISAFDYDLLVKQGCQPNVGDVLIAKDGNTALDTTCLIKKSLPVVLLSSVAILRPNPKKLLAEYLKQYLSAP
jgi:type I restriction enzyme S subunit